VLIKVTGATTSGGAFEVELEFERIRRAASSSNTAASFTLSRTAARTALEAT
jgi:hypothetical protein